MCTRCGVTGTEVQTGIEVERGRDARWLPENPLLLDGSSSLHRITAGDAAAIQCRVHKKTVQIAGETR